MSAFTEAAAKPDGVSSQRTVVSILATMNTSNFYQFLKYSYLLTYLLHGTESLLSR